MAASKRPGSVHVSFDPKNATPQSLQDVTALALKLAGCTGCGRLSRLQLDFAINPAETNKIKGVNNIQTMG